MSLRQDLLEGWTLAAESPLACDQVRSYPIASSRVSARCVVSTSGTRGLLLDLEGRRKFAPPRGLRKGQGGALEAEISRFNQGTASLEGLCIWCVERDLMEAFIAFCVALLERVAGGVSVPDALELCFSEFVRLVTGPSPLSDSALAGLLGELLVVEGLVQTDPELVRTWAGKNRERNDFRHGLVAIEVKASLRAKNSTPRVTISTLDQLAVNEPGKLYLHVVHLERAQAGAVSLPIVVGRLRPVLSPSQQQYLDEGIASLTKDFTDPRAFSILSLATYRVEGDFPRLIPASLIAGRPAPGVSGVSYELELGAASPWSVELDVALRALATSVVA